MTTRRSFLDRPAVEGVVFTADHGDMQGGHGCYDKTAYSTYEETSRIRTNPQPARSAWMGETGDPAAGGRASARAGL